MAVVPGADRMPRPLPAWTPPLRNGVGASRVAATAGPWVTWQDFLIARLPNVATQWPGRLARGDVLDAQGQAIAGEAPCVPGTLLWYWRDPPPEPRVPFELGLLHHDDHLVVVDKPHFLSVMPGGRHLQETALVRLKQMLGIATLVPLHRLDRDTAGVLLFSVRPDSRNAYAALFREQRVHKVYEAVAAWRDDLAFPLHCDDRLVQPTGPGFMQMQVVAGEPNAQTQVELVQRLRLAPALPEAAPAGTAGPALAQASASQLALYRLTPRSGRRHQLRAQLNALGLPIVGDRIYPVLRPDRAADETADYSQPLQLLARELAFTDPLSGEARCFTSQRQLLLARLATPQATQDLTRP